MMNIKSLCLLVTLFTLSCLGISDVHDSMTKDSVELSMDKHAQLLLNDSTVNAISIGVYKAGKIYTNHYGELDRGHGNKPTNKTIYEIGSVSKTFAGTLVAQAELEGMLSLEDDIRKYLKEDFPNFEYEGQPIRIKDLITHTSGLPKFLPKRISELLENPDDNVAFEIHEIDKGYSKKSFFNDLHSIELASQPGSTFAYSNIDTELIAHLLENIYGKSYNALIQEKISSKLGLIETGTILPNEHKDRLANGYTHNNALAPHMDGNLWNAGGGIKSTLPDLLRYAAFQLDKENLLATRSHQVVFESTYDKIAYYWPVRHDDANDTYYSHHGGTFGTQNYLFIFPERDLAVSVVINQSLSDTGNKLVGIVSGILQDLG